MQIDHLSTLQAIRKTLQNGFQGLYSGFNVPFCAQAVFKSVMFCTNTLSRQYLFQGDHSTSSLFTSGLIAGSVNSLIVAPVEIVRTHQILAAGSSSSSSLWQIMSGLRAQHGLSVFWSGWPPAILRDGPGVGVYLLTFEEMKKYLLQRHSPSSSSSSTTAPPPLWVRVVSGSTAGIAFWTWAIPIDTIKTLIESTYRSSTNKSNITFFEVIKQVRDQINLSRMYRALPLAYMRGIPSAAVTLTVYDIVIEKITTTTTLT
eukprot:scaffold4338_cov183-Ochromonas_danica.AAC.4